MEKEKEEKVNKVKCQINPDLGKPIYMKKKSVSEIPPIVIYYPIRLAGLMSQD